MCIRDRTKQARIVYRAVIEGRIQRWLPGDGSGRPPAKEAGYTDTGIRKLAEAEDFAAQPVPLRCPAVVIERADDARHLGPRDILNPIGLVADQRRCRLPCFDFGELLRIP